MNIFNKLLDVVYYPDSPLGPTNNIILDNEGDIDTISILILSSLVIGVIVLSVLLIRKIRRRIG